MSAVITISDDFLRLLYLLVESMPEDIAADGYTSVSVEQREARKLLDRLKRESHEPNN